MICGIYFQVSIIIKPTKPLLSRNLPSQISLTKLVEIYFMPNSPEVSAAVAMGQNSLRLSLAMCISFYDSFFFFFFTSFSREMWLLVAIPLGQDGLFPIGHRRKCYHNQRLLLFGEHYQPSAVIWMIYWTIIPANSPRSSLFSVSLLILLNVDKGWTSLQCYVKVNILRTWWKGFVVRNCCQLLSDNQ